MTDTKRIESYGLYDFCKDIQEALNEGYVFDFDTNENFPTAYGTMLTCGLVRPVEAEVKTAEGSDAQTEQTEEVVQNEVQKEVTETAEVTEVAEVPESAPAKRGPKPKAK